MHLAVAMCTTETEPGCHAFGAAAAHWFNNTGPKFIERRRARLQQYLNDLVDPSSGLAELPEIQDFFGVRSVHVQTI